jgi:CHAT domain-containing protein
MPLLVGVTEGKPRLPKTKAQVEYVQQWLGLHGVKSTPLWNEAATPIVVKERLQQASFFHISCHGAFAQEKPEDTGLQLVTSSGSIVLLSLQELFQLDLSRLHLATLISCWGADNFILPGRWIISLPEVFWRAGARGVIASLWEVSEDRACQFVNAFYSALPGRSADRALQKAQLDAIKRSGNDPVDWAGFQMYGTPVRLRI